MAGIESYKRALEREETKLKLKLASGKGSAFEVALHRVICEILRYEIGFPGSVLVFDKMGPDPLGFTGPDRWVQSALKKAADKINPTYGTDDEYVRKYEEYFDLSIEILSWGRVRQELIQDK